MNQNSYAKYGGKSNNRPCYKFISEKVVKSANGSRDGKSD